MNFILPQSFSGCNPFSLEDVPRGFRTGLPVHSWFERLDDVGGFVVAWTGGLWKRGQPPAGVWARYQFNPALS